MYTSIFQSVNERLSAWPSQKIIYEALNACPEVNCYLTGGVVRNTILEFATATKDFDYILEGSDTLKFIDYLSRHGKISMTPFGSVRWHPESSISYADILKTSSFFAGLEKCSSIHDVLMNFDFTGNAIAVDLKEGIIIDPVGGVEDLYLKTMRAVRFDFPDSTITEGSILTYLGANVFRCKHYAEKLKLTIEPKTLSWIDSYARVDEMAYAYESLLGVLTP